MRQRKPFGQKKQKKSTSGIRLNLSPITLENRERRSLGLPFFGGGVIFLTDTFS
jgi:hypothetical protein